MCLLDRGQGHRQREVASHQGQAASHLTPHLTRLWFISLTGAAARDAGAGRVCDVNATLNQFLSILATEGTAISRFILDGDVYRETMTSLLIQY